MLRSSLFTLAACWIFFLQFPAVVAAAQSSDSLSTVKSAARQTSVAEFLGYPLGQWHLRHDQINFYLNQLARESARVSIERTGQSHEARQQLTAVITSAENQARLEDILKQREKVKLGDKQQGPLVIWLAYSIHGDEASGAHAALSLSHLLASSNEKWITRLLDEAVILVTPSQNPDGFDRFSNWTNNYRGQVDVSDNNHREHRQNWPGGRSNHYFADLNRDWLFLRHPESQGRVALFHKWQPHYVGDFHEMGRDRSYFFQPGVPTRTHPLTPKENQALTAKLAKFHQRALDEIKQSYFSRQMFDDFYYGKGSTYPDINGSVGVLFEQASVRGQVQATDNGEMRFEDAISNQLATSISSLKGSLKLKDELLEYQSKFYRERGKKLQRGRQQGFIIGAPSNGNRIAELSKLLAQHHIDFYYLTKPVTQGKIDFAVQSSLFIPVNQPQKSLLLAMFDNRTEFDDPTFYDVSGWNLEHAFHLELIRNIKLDIDVLSKEQPDLTTFTPTEHTVALLIDWRQDNAAPMLEQLLQTGIHVKFAEKAFTIRVDGTDIDYPPGSLQVPLKQSAITPQEILSSVTEALTRYPLNIASVNTSAVRSGIDLGSPDFHPVKPIKTLLVTGQGTNASEAGELWYYLDTKLAAPVTLVDVNRLARLSLDEYSHVILPGGDYSTLDEKFARKLGQFASQGGIIVAQKGALSWLNKGHLLKTDLKEARFYKQLFDSTNLSFADREKLDARQSIGGATLELTLDPSHPLSFGVRGNSLPILKNKALGLTQTSTPFVVAAKYAEEPLLNGYLAREYQRSLSNGPAILLESRGKGAVVLLADNLMFRNIWLGSEKVYANALYFVPALD
ncbi:M14 family zinc carboxypeptidase [Shewanella atlantica]|uniref:M14 family zinc carboxypeptidase n=1 Tax=Shewanella atlantica TaxID=271099 RepID=UPI0037350F8E